MNIPPSTMHNSSKCSKNPGYLCTVMILSGCCFWVLSSRRGWAGLLGVLGGDLIVPATTPVPHLTSLGDLYRSCRSNQSSPDCSHLTVVIRPTPNDFCEFFRLGDNLIRVCFLQLPPTLSTLLIKLLSSVSPSTIGFPVSRNLPACSPC